GLAAVGGGADEAGEVVEVQLLRRQVRAQERARATGGDAGVAAQVAVADGPGEAVVVPGGALAFDVAGEVAVEGVGRRRREGDAEQRVQVGQVFARERELQVEVAEPQRIEQGPARMRGSGAGPRARIDAIWAVRILQVQRGLGTALERERAA